MDYLPREIVLDILSRLPVTSLLHFKLVCRAWRRLAQDPYLVYMHLSRMGENDPCLVLHCDYPLRNQLYSLELSAHNEDNQRVNKISVPTLPEFDVVGSCKGLLCLCDSLTKNSVYIYNPFSRDYIELPKSVEFQNQEVLFGFGFHPTTKEYKVTKIIYYRIPTGAQERYFHRRFLLHSEVQIFTLGNTAWRSLGRLSHHILQGPSQVLVSGRLHWSTWPRRRRPGRLLISFDLADEQFRVVPKPDCGDLDRHHYDLVVLGGYLAAAVPCNYGKFEIWIMKNYDMKESWIKEFSIGIHVPRGLEHEVAQSFRGSKFYKRSFSRVLCLLKSGHILLSYRCRALVSYDPKSGNFKDLMINGLPNWFEAHVHYGCLNRTDALFHS